VWQCLQAPARIGQKGQALTPTRIGQVRPAVVVLVVSSVGGMHGVVAEEAVEECISRVAEAHRLMVPCARRPPDLTDDRRFGFW
jgi:hypothetical protein